MEIHFSNGFEIKLLNEIYKNNYHLRIKSILEIVYILRIKNFTLI